MPKVIDLPSLVGKGYGEFWRCKKRYRVLKGGKGSKKSTTTALNFIVRLMQMPKSNLLVVRAVYNTHKDSTFAQLQWAQEKLGVRHLWTNTISPLEMTYKPTGQKILFRGFDDVLKLASTTVPSGYLNFVWLEEAYEIKTLDEFEKLDLSVPRGSTDGEVYKQTTLTFNPWSDRHWLKARFFDNPDNDTAVFSTDYRCNEFLDDTDIRVFERMKAENPRKYAVAGMGEWGIAEGLIYNNWTVEAFEPQELGVQRNEDGDIIKDEHYKYKAFFGLDFGYTNDPSAFVCVWVNPTDKEAYIFDEFYVQGMLNEDIAKAITDKGYAKEIIRADCSEPKSIAELQRAGIQRVRPSVKGKDSIMNGIDTIQSYHLTVHPRCKNAISELSAYCFKTDKSGRTINEPIDSDNHLLDALRYAFYDVQYFAPKEHTRKHLTADEKINKKYGITSADMKGGWL